MKLSIPCMQCGFPKDGTSQDFKLYSVPVRDDSVYEIICCRGHKTVTVLQEEKYEILFEIAINAVSDGYYRDAVASATSSLERFYEFFVRVVCRAYKIPAPELEAAWKHVKSTSERQLGMFLATHILHFKKAPMLMPGKRVEFRNDVIHKGHIPLKEEAVNYINTVLELINPILIEIKKTMADSAQALTMERLTERHSRLGEIPRATMSIGSLVSLVLSLSEPHPTNIEAALKRIEDKRFKG